MRSWLDGHLTDTSENRASSRNPGEQHESEETQEESGDCDVGLREDAEGPRQVSFREHSGISMARDEVSGEEQGAKRGQYLRDRLSVGQAVWPLINRTEQGDQSLSVGVRPGIQLPLGCFHAKSDKTWWAHL